MASSALLACDPSEVDGPRKEPPHDVRSQGFEKFRSVPCRTVQKENGSQYAGTLRRQSRSRKRLETDGEPGRGADPAQGQQHAGGERDPVERVVPDGERLPHAAEHDLLVGDQPADPQAVHADPVDVRAARPVEPGVRGVGHRAQSRLAAGVGDQLRRTTGRAGGRVDLVRVVELHDLGGLVEPGRLGREAHHQDRADREVRRDQHARCGPSPSQPRSRSSRASSNPVVPTTAWMPWSMQNSRLSITTPGWVKSTTASAPPRPEPGDVVVRVDLRDQRQVVGCLDRRAHLAPDLAPRAQDADLELAHGVSLERSARSPQSGLPGSRPGRPRSRCGVRGDRPLTPPRPRTTRRRRPRTAVRAARAQWSRSRPGGGLEGGDVGAGRADAVGVRLPPLLERAEPAGHADPAAGHLAQAGLAHQRRQVALPRARAQALTGMRRVEVLHGAQNVVSGPVRPS